MNQAGEMGGRGGGGCRGLARGCIISRSDSTRNLVSLNIFCRYSVLVKVLLFSCVHVALEILIIPFVICNNQVTILI
jgi:hypothetical protein